MKILYLHQYFKTPKDAGGTRSFWIAKELILNGFEVTVITGRENKSKKKEIEEIDGIKVIYLHVPYDNKMGIVKRIKSFLSFSLKSTYYTLKEKDVTLTFATSTPLTIGIPALFRKLIKRTSFVFEVRDLWPEVPIQLGALKNSILKKIATALEKLIYKHSSHIIALSPGMEAGVLKYVDSNKVSMVPNMSKADVFYTRPHNLELAKKIGIDVSKYNVIYFGAMGEANGLHYIVETAKLLNDKDVNFIFIGGGKVEDDLKHIVETHNLKNVLFLGKKPVNEVSEIVNLCDLSIVSFANIPILRTNSPNKLFDSLSAGKPIIVNSSGWTKNIVEDNKCGFYVDPTNPSDFKDKIEILMNDSILSKEMGNNSRVLAETKYDISILVPKVTNVLKIHAQNDK